MKGQEGVSSYEKRRVTFMYTSSSSNYRFVIRNHITFNITKKCHTKTFYVMV